MAFQVVLLAIEAALTLLSFVLRPKLPKAGTDPLVPDIATAQAGDPIPVFFGRCLLPGNVTWWGDVEKRDGTEWEQNVPQGVTTYYLTMQQVLGWGPLDVVFDVWLDKTKKVSALSPQTEYSGGYVVGTGWTTTGTYDPLVIVGEPPGLPWINPHTAPTYREFDVRALKVYGGVKKEGGVEGPVFLHTGDVGAGQAADTDVFLDDKLDTFHSGVFHTQLPNLIYAAYHHVYFGVSPNIKAWLWEVGRYPNNLGDATKCRIGDESNPAEIIWETLTSQLWGVGMASVDLDIDSFQIARDTLYAEGCGISIVFSGKTSADETLTNILGHIDGVLVEDPFTGLIRLKLIRQDYVIGETALIADTNFTAKSVTLARAQWRDLVTEVVIHFTSRAAYYNEGVSQFQNLALQQRLGERRSEDIQYKGFCTAEIAQIAGERALRTLSSVIAKGTIVCEGVGRVIAVGDVFRLSWAPYELVELPVRATKVNYGNDASDPVTIEFAEDIFGEMPIIYTPPPDSGWVDGRTVYHVPDVVEHPSETTTTGTLEISVYDPDSHVTAVEFRSIVGGGTPSSWVTDASIPYSATITKDFSLNTSIEWRVTYTAADLTSQTLTGSYPFGPRTKPSPPHINPVADATTGDTAYASVTGASTTNIKFSYSKTGYPSLTTVRATSLVSVPASGTIPQATSTLALGETLYFTTLAYDSGSIESDPTFEQTTRAAPVVTAPTQPVTVDDEHVAIPGSRQLVAETGDTTIDTATANQIKVALAAIIAGATVGDGTHVAQITYDTKGRITAASAVAITFPSTPAALTETAFRAEFGDGKNASSVVAATFGQVDRVPYIVTFDRWEIFAYDASGNPVAIDAVVDILATDYATNSFTSVMGGVFVTLSAASKNELTTLAWSTTTFSADHMFRAKLVSYTGSPAKIIVAVRGVKS